MSCLFLSSGFSSERLRLNKDWLFKLDDITEAKSPDFDDSGWRKLNVPHDWAFENGFHQDGAQADKGGYAIGGIGWYRKNLLINKELLDKYSRFFIQFDAVYMNSEVWINGHYLGKRPYGYVSFEYEISKYIKAGNNIISVRVDNSLEPSARWYHGCGVYGNVYLNCTDKFRLTNSDIYISTPTVGPEKAVIQIDYTPSDSCNDKLDIDYQIISDKGEIIATLKNVSINSSKTVSNINLESPVLWDLDNPYLYTLVTVLKKENKIIDRMETRFGIRTIDWKADTGFWLNGENIKLRGVCEHLEGGPIGAAWTENMMRWKITMLKEMGCNSIRTAHNAQLPIFYDICDELGILVLDEFFDGWKQKAPHDYGSQAFSEWWEKDLRSLVRRDRNHPSVILYSVGNETRSPVAESLVKVCHEEDYNCKVTSGYSGSNFMDITGINGHSERKSFIQTYKPDGKVFIGTETPHTWHVRGYYRTITWYRDGYPNKRQDPFETPDLTNKEIFNYEWASPQKWTNKKQHFNSSYDNAYVRLNARQNIEYLRDLPWYSGSYRWTGFDYLGEAGYVHGGWPFRGFMGGVIDLAGFKKDHYYLYQAEWTSTPMVHILPHWTHPDMKKGTLIPVQVYTTGDEAELFINGRSLGKQAKGLSWDKMACTWLVPWEEGKLNAIAYKDNKIIAESSVFTINSPEVINVRKENSFLTGNEEDIHIVTISQDNKENHLYPYGENRVYFNTDGCEIVSAENGNPTDTECNWRAKSRCAFFGMLRTFIRCNSPESILHAGAILGDKRLKSSDKISIDVKSMEIMSGRIINKNYDIYYTTDGTEPCINSPKYKGAFSVPRECIIKAVIISDGKEILRMEEKFGKDEGIFWHNENDNIEFDLKGIQAESCKYNGFKEDNILKKHILFLPKIKPLYPHIRRMTAATGKLH